MDVPAYLDHLGREVDTLLTAATGATDRIVPSCPDWSVADLLDHQSRVYRWAAAQAAAPAGTRVRMSEIPKRPDGDDPLGWFEASRDEVVPALHAMTEPDEEIETFAGPQPRRFWARRMALETAVHRWDVEGAVREPTAIATDLAVDGIDEVLAVQIPRLIDLPTLDAQGATFHLHATDAEGEWLIAVSADGIDVSHGHAKGDAAARGTASDLLLYLWGRIPPQRLEAFGDTGLVDRWQRATRI
jgi:uncharacterized protein (TIGR03083 family)